MLLSTFFSSAYALDNHNSSSATNELLQTTSSHQDQNDIINTPQDQNDTELVMFILKCIEDKHITEINKKIAFVNTFKVSNDIKDYAISLITQDLNYSDHKKDSYGTYILQPCNNPSTLKSSSLNGRSCYVDYAPNGHGTCKAQRSNVCCVNTLAFAA